MGDEPFEVASNYTIFIVALLLLTVDVIGAFKESYRIAQLPEKLAHVIYFLMLVVNVIA